MHRKDCGLSPADLARLRADVEVVIHSAASISFFEHVHVLLQQNYQVSHILSLVRISISETTIAQSIPEAITMRTLKQLLFG